MDELKTLRREVAELHRANEILTTASAFSWQGSTRHSINGRVHRRIQELFQGRTDPQGPREIIGLRVPHAARLPHVQKLVAQPYGRPPRGTGP